MMLNKLKKLNIIEHLNIIITSDHGMTSRKSNCKINASDFLNMSLIDVQKSIFGQISHIYPKTGFVRSTFILNRFYPSPLIGSNYL
jgi:predicted AlkP superfamily pyrophosphatase or phosphodiesterase